MSSVAGLMALTTIALGGGQTPSKARDCLVSCMQRSSRVNVIAILMQRDSSVEGCFQQVKLERASDGHSRHTVLQPLRMQGIASVDDGDTLTLYLPGEKTIVRRESQSAPNQDLVQRIDLASKNYSFRFEPRADVAGRSAFCVLATPNHAGIDARRFYIDEHTFFPLKLETVSAGNVRVIYDTKYIDYPKSMNSTSFRIDVVKPVREVRYAKPKSISSKSEAELELDFSPIMPKFLPFGFQMQDMQVRDSGPMKSLMFRLTDGLARATVFEWRNDKNEPKMKPLDDFSVGERNGVRVMIVSDLDEDIRIKLLRAFLQQMSNWVEPPDKLIGCNTPASPKQPGTSSFAGLLIFYKSA